MSTLHQCLIYFAAAVIAVPLFNRLRLGSLLGFLAAGVVIGPCGMGFIDDVASVLHFSEFGVVLLLFLIGLELQPSRLWEMRRIVFGLGGLQMAGCTAILALVAWAAGMAGPIALWVGAAMSLSSTALALQLLADKNQLTEPFGRSTFGVLLFQDLAVIPLLAVVPLVSPQVTAGHPSMDVGLLRVVGVLVLVGTGKYFLRPVLHLIAKQNNQELFTAAALLVVVGTATLVSWVGLSMALGAFIAGMLLSDSEFRHELEADLAPFKGLLLGLFFIAVGMSANLYVFLSNPGRTLLAVVALVAVKFSVLFALGWRQHRNLSAATRFACAISQGGEFAFVLFRLSVDNQVLSPAVADQLVMVVTLSMATTPVLQIVVEKWLARRAPAQKPDYDVAPSTDAPVIIAGFGRVGQVVGRVLRAKNILFTALDESAEHIEFIRKFGGRVFYGDAARLDMLKAARTEQARVFVLAIDHVEASVRCAALVRRHFPKLTIIARARNRQHVYALRKVGVEHVIRETWHSSLQMTGAVLESFGYNYATALDILERFAQHDNDTLDRAYKVHENEKELLNVAMAARAELEGLFAQDAEKA